MQDKKLPFAEQLCFDPAQGFGCDAQVGSDLLLRHPLEQGGVFADKLQVAAFCRMGNSCVEAAFEHGVCPLHHDPENTFEAGDLPEKFFLAFEVDGQQLGIFEGLDKKVGRPLFVEAAYIADPPVLHGELQDHLIAVLVDIVFLNTPLYDVGFEAADLALPEKQGFLF